jgi:hypothetical protein
MHQPRASVVVGPIPADGEGPQSIVEPPLLIGAIAWALFVGRDVYQRRSCAENGHPSSDGYRS